MSLFDDQNPWRQNPAFKVDPYVQRGITPILDTWLDEKEAILLYGPRQAGKTTVLWKLIEMLLVKGIPASSLYYFNFERPEIRELAGHPEALLRMTSAGRSGAARTYLFIDEAQRLEDPGLSLKALTDLPGSPFKLVISGSSSLELKAKTKESLTGRKVSFEIWPLSFREYARARQSTLPEAPESADDWPDFLRLYGPALEDAYFEMLMFGGYPGLLHLGAPDKKRSLLRELYHDYVEKDVRNYLRVENVVAFNKLARLLVFQQANLVNKSELAGSAGVDQRTIESYLRILEETFVAHLLPPFFANRRKEVVHAPKVFFNDVGLANALAERFESAALRPDQGALVENFVFTELRKNHPAGSEIRFWRTHQGAEIDFVLVKGEKLIGIEAKAGRLERPVVRRGTRRFIETHHPAHVLVLNRTLVADTHIGDTAVHFLPVPLFAWLGPRLFEQWLA